MEHKATISEVCEGVIAEMVNRRYALSTIRQVKYNCNRFIRYVQKRGLPQEFTESIGAEYLKDTFGYDEYSETWQLSHSALENVNTVSKLGEYRLHGTFHSTIQPWTVSYEWAGGDNGYVEMFIDSESKSGKRDTTVAARRHAVRYFYEFMNARSLTGLDNVTGEILSDFVRSRASNSNNYLYNLLIGLKQYFRFMYHQGHCAKDLEQLIPTVQRRKNVNVPALWSEDELIQLLTSIDRSNPSGKRDFAILLMVVQLGIRVSDIAALKLSDLDFDRKTIAFTQQKTEKSVVYPMLDDVGWALIDWIRHGRAKIESPFVFLTCHSMPAEFANGAAVGSILHRRMKLSGIRKDARNTATGMHSLRHAMARRLVENDTGLHDIVSIMGHRNTNATSKYARTDIKGLRECALSIGGVERCK